MCGSVWLSCFVQPARARVVALLCCCPQGWLSCVPIFYVDHRDTANAVLFCQLLRESRPQVCHWPRVLHCWLMLTQTLLGHRWHALHISMLSGHGLRSLGSSTL